MDNARTQPDQAEELTALLRKIRMLKLETVQFSDFYTETPEISSDRLVDTLAAVNAPPPNCLIIDVRTPAEYACEAVPHAVNLPILSAQERHDVGLIYKQHDHKLALSYAYWLANAKTADYLSEIRNRAAGRDIVVYCWRGGGRSRYVASLLARHGMPVNRLSGGHKSFRKAVHQTLYTPPLTLYPLSGPTGCGKTALIEYLLDTDPELPILDLEGAAGHAASVFGHLRYDQGAAPESQRQFELNLFMQMLPHRRSDGGFPPMLTEYESRKIGAFQLPPDMFKAVVNGPHILVTAPLEDRVARLRREYFKDTPVQSGAQIKQALVHLKKQLGKKKIACYSEWIDRGDYDRFLRAIITEYYDTVYRPAQGDPVLTVDITDLSVAAQKIRSFLMHQALKK